MMTPFDCPRCGTVLTMSDRQGIEIDYCAQCRGVWLDRGELDKLLERAGPFLGAGAGSDPAAGAPPASGWTRPAPDHQRGSPYPSSPAFPPAPPPAGWRGKDDDDDWDDDRRRSQDRSQGHGGGHGGGRRRNWLSDMFD